MKRVGLPAGTLAALGLLAGCAMPPVGPSVAVMPGQNKSFDAFQRDQAVCTGYANQQVGGQPQAVNNQAVGGAVLGTVLGAGLGAAAGGGTGAAIGAASGAVVGTGLGASASSGSQWNIQRRYDIAYAQCMAANGNQVPTSQAAYGPVAPPPAVYTGYGYPYGYGYGGGYYPYGYYDPYAYGPAFSIGLGFGGGWGWGRGWGGWHHGRWR